MDVDNSRITTLDKAGVEASVSVKPMRLSDGRVDYYVSISCGDREVTPHVFRERYKAEYHVALYDWLLNGKPKPNLMAFNPEDFPALSTLPAEPAPADVAEMVRTLESACLDWDSSEMQDAEMPRVVLACGEIRSAASLLTRVAAERDGWNAACMEAREGCNQRSATISSLRRHLEAAEARAEAAEAALAEARNKAIDECALIAAIARGNVRGSGEHAKGEADMALKIVDALRSRRANEAKE